VHPGLQRAAGDRRAAVLECLPLFGTIVAQGTSTDVANLSVGTHRFQCIFHPWMRQSVEVRPT
jgi:hypothetical protein